MNDPNWQTPVQSPGYVQPLRDSPSVSPHELQGMRGYWWCFLLVGILLIMCGIASLTYPFFFSIGVTIAIGVALLISGVSTIVASFWAGKWSAFLVQLLIGILYTVLGLAIAEAPLASTAAMTLLVASFAIAGGLFRIVAALTNRFPQWGWVLLNGTVTLLLGVIIFRHFPEASLWLIGTLVGVDLVFSGITWTMLSTEVLSLPKEESQTTLT